MYILGPCGSLSELFCEAGSFSHCCNPHRFFQSAVVKLYLPTLEPWAVQSVLLPSCSPVYLHANVGPLVPPATAHPSPRATVWPAVLSAQLPFFTPPTCLDECFFLNFLVGLPYSLIFCQYWLVLFLNLLLSFFWLCNEAQCIYLCLIIQLFYSYQKKGLLCKINLKLSISKNPQ